MIEARTLSKSFGRVRAVRGVSFSVPKGQLVGVLGPNGAGKTTTIRMLTGYLPPDGGSCSVDGYDCTEDSEHTRARVGYLPESAPLYREMRVTDYLHHRGRLFGMARTDRRAAVDRVIERCWLREMRSRRIGTLSKGYRQRVGLAAALLHDPPVLILDEPTSGLDPVQIVETRRLLIELAGDRTMLLSSHILPEVEKTCERIIIIAGGEIRADGAPADLIAKAAGAGSIVVEARAAQDGADFASLGRMAGVASIAGDEPLEGGWRRITLSAARADLDIREPVARAASEAGLIVRELRPVRPTLEQVFERAIGRDAAALSPAHEEAHA